MATASSSPSIQDLSDSGDYYLTALDVYDRGSGRIRRICEWAGENIPALADSIDVSLSKDSALNVLSVGGGDGMSDSTILARLLDRTHPRIRAVILEPDSHMMHQYQDLVKKESAKLQGVNFDWRQQTFQEYLATAEEDEKFHFISCISSIYYLGDLEVALKRLYEILAAGGILLVTLVKGDGGFGRLWQYHYKSVRTQKTRYITSSDIKEACRRQSIPIADTQTIRISCDITACFDPPQQISKDGDLLLDFLTHTVNFSRNAPAVYRDDLLQFLGSEACTYRGSDGEVIFNGNNEAVIIRKQ
ncbi:histamine N-methyltransferase A-like [Acanthaster planci]|uniref:Histamine N-methyltransferase A-like n=1 Tax=Acanthaster planci TaxID=133434 RepID=A0A8B7XFS8_ACAPL|nr:histamine N-methyltransferase A-like [Acanthaster planci]